ncbi:MAG: hypothetical protein B7Y74_07755 [Novosphingobium sp. 35-62-5]|nr:MAG: hypothetical protein B7Y81_19265 [Caulobacter sp. 32-67-35]OYX94194.1 MAG: hypothetical protein B7Y74_07755 [Novosphingobium sp. 35-62-5]OZA73600.1 MAG: hypothetical protein B7X77_09635 [Caulobacter sp. 39-67-4]HQR90559.1 hypothetical protein [Caulobacter sp.]
MSVALLAALQIVTATSEWVWADISISDARGSVDRIQILPKVTIEGDRQVLRTVVARRTNTFAGKTMEIQWSDTSRCPGLRASLDAISEVRVLAESTLSKSYEGLTNPPPPPPHRPVATVEVAGMRMNAIPESPLGLWVHGVTVATAGCWSEKAP